MLRRLLAVASVTGALLLTGGSARAEGTTSEADTLFAQGRELLEKGQFGEACARLKKSQELAPAVGTLLNLGYCWEQLAKYKSAMEAYAAAEVLAGKTGDAKRSTFAKERLAASQAKVLKILVLVTPPAPDALEIKRNGAVVPKSEWGQPMFSDPEEVAIEASAPGRQPWKTVVMGRGEGATITVFVPPLAEGSGGATTTGTAASAGGLPSKRIVAIGLGVAAVTAIGAGVATGLYAKARYDDSLHHCDATGCDPAGLDVQKSAVTQGNVATALVGLGLLCAGAGTYLWLTGGDDSAKVKAGIGPTGAAIGGRF